MADTGKDPIPELKKSLGISKSYKNITPNDQKKIFCKFVPTSFEGNLGIINGNPKPFNIFLV